MKGQELQENARPLKTIISLFLPFLLLVPEQEIPLINYLGRNLEEINFSKGNEKVNFRLWLVIYV
jgi:hypothetical protein